MQTSFKKFIILEVLIAALSLASSTRAALLSSVSIQLSNHAPSQTAVLQTIKFTPTTSVAAPGDVKIVWPANFDFSAVAASADVTVSGGGVTWAAPVNGDLTVATRTLILNWTSGALTPGNQVTVTMAFTKNPTAAANYNVVISTGPDGFSTATDSRTIPVVIVNAGVAVSAIVPAPPTNPTITNISPIEPVVVDVNTTAQIFFTLTDANNNNISYTVTPSFGSISISPSPVSPVSGTTGGVTVSFTYFANGGTGNPSIAVTANDGLDNTSTGQPAQPVVYNIDVLVI